MSLIATARALDDPRFIWRVKAATLTTAAQKVSDPDGPDQWFAEHVLDHPMQANDTMAALVAANSVIAGEVQVDSINTVNTEAVPDSDILYVVGDSWSKVAARYDELMHPVNAPATTV